MMLLSFLQDELEFGILNVQGKRKTEKDEV